MDTGQEISIEQTRTGYWVVRRGTVQLGGAMTRRGAEGERELLKRLAASRHRRRTRGSRATVSTQLNAAHSV